MRLFFVLGLALVIIGFAFYERITSLAWPAALLLLGNASFSIYLIHNPLLSVTQRLAAQLQFDVVTALVMGIALSLLAGFAYYRLVERPSLRFFRHHLSRA